jgi:predicted transcriptional regulator
MSVDERRPMGSLEADVLRYLWNASEPATPGQVHAGLDADVAYTTVMTVLTRLWSKDLVGREKQGRAYAYWALVSEAEYAAKRMRDALGKAQDRAAVLSRFVDTLSAREAKALRRVLDDRGGKR